MQLKSVRGRILAAIGATTCLGVALNAQAQCTGYTIQPTSSASYIAATNDTGNHADDGTTGIALPFSVTFYGASYNTATVSSNGNLQFTTNVTAYANTCPLPTATFAGPTIMPYWDDLYTVTTAAGQGIFTETVGTAPNRIFVIEWRTQNCCSTAAYIHNFELQFREGTSDFDIIYNAPIGDGSSATIGCQESATGASSQFSCNAANVTSTTKLHFACIAASTSGACCLNNGTSACSFTNAAGCTSAGGTFNGIGSSCSTQCAPHACCITSGGCIIVGTTSCPAGSTNQGAGTTCVSNPCPGEDCVNPIVLGTGPNVSGTGDLTNAGPTAVIAPAVCASSSRDMFFSYTPATSNLYAITTCNAITGTLDTVLSIHSSCPGDGSTMIAGACSDDNCTGGVGPSTISNFQMDAGTTYIIRVARWNTGAGAPFRVDVTSDPFGSCCLPAGTCQLSGQTACGTAGGTFAGGATCSTAACQGTCCDAATGACTLTGPTGCSSTFGGLGTSCTPNPCPGQACCNNTTAVCTFTGTTACPAGTTSQGVGSTCAAVACPAEACCNPATGVCSVAGPGACASGTTGQGVGTSCTPNPCPQPPPPANDECANAFPLVVNAAPIAGTNINSTDSLVTHSCTGSTLDVWYSFVASAAGTFTATADSNDGTLISIIAYDTCGGTELGCQAALVDPATLTFSVPGAGTYLLRVATFVPATTYQVSIVTTISGACCNNTTAACTTSTTGAGGCAAGTTYQGDNSVCTPSPCQGEACCNAATGVCTFAAVGQCASGTTGQGVGSVCTPNPCPQPPPPANDDCSGAIALTVNVAFSGNNTSATGDGTEGPGGACYTTSPTNFNKAVWFRFTAPASDVFGITACGSSFDTVLSVFDGTCAAFGSELGCDDDTCDGVTPPGSGLASIIAPVSMTAGQTYLIRLSSWGTGNGAYTITVTGTAPAGVCCRGSTCSTAVASAAACTGSLIGGQTAGASFPSAASCNNTGVTTTPCCYADYNKVNGIGVQDIFDFLNDWFAGSPYANTGGTGAPGPLSVQNIFDFLNAWFSGGC